MENTTNKRLSSYIEAALFSSTDDEGNPLDQNYTISDIDPVTLLNMEASLNAFFRELESLQLLEKANEFKDDEYIAHDFWLTRNGHGAGFWDGDYAASHDDRKLGDRLTDVAKSFGGCDLYVGDDGMIYQY